MNTILILKSLYKINSAAKTLAVLKQDAYDSGSHRMCAMYKIEQNRLYTLKTLVIQQLVSDGVLKEANPFWITKADCYLSLPQRRVIFVSIP